MLKGWISNFLGSRLRMQMCFRFDAFMYMYWKGKFERMGFKEDVH